MHRHFITPFQSLPTKLAVFPLPNVALMPGARLPLNIFEPRYIAMVQDALNSSRLIGMIQPATEGGQLAAVGGAGRIQFFNETDDGRIEIILTGVCRFELNALEETASGYLLGTPDWQRFQGDYEAELKLNSDRQRIFLDHLEAYAHSNRLAVDREALNEMDGLQLVNGLITGMPFPGEDKQSLLEIERAEDRLDWLETYLALKANAGTSEALRH
ncbi:LON peptidase substrate-binding domain-containing protein [Nitrincola tapanii]|uniref:Peptidase S16 n=1 Tax=Nitrincola tapanii TaxID=1708751 RepID=A0A5A9W3T4_9GAMM|nr:LON peptidase substrate-binding domain-containing protein [Nitrincola tapanii]KAA0875430.1 peptidase S16 [Nitrincola tapanii]